MATPDNLDEVEQVLAFAMKHSLGFQVSPEIVGTAVNPSLRENERYRQLIDEVIASKTQQRGVFGVPEYLLGIKKFSPVPLPSAIDARDSSGRTDVLSLPGMETGGNRTFWRSGDYWEALCVARKRFGEIPACHDCCHIFCHMALSLLQTHPLSALGELKHWRN